MHFNNGENHFNENIRVDFIRFLERRKYHSSYAVLRARDPRGHFIRFLERRKYHSSYAVLQARDTFPLYESRNMLYYGRSIVT